MLDRLLWQSPTIFGRLSYAASLRDPDSRRYRHGVLPRALSENDIDGMIRSAHRKMFYHWLGLRLSQQRGDLMRFLDTGDEWDGAVVAAWGDHSLQSSLIPDEVGDHERRLFLQDFRTVLHSVRNNFDEDTIETVELRPVRGAKSEDGAAPGQAEPETAARGLLGRLAFGRGR
jgi:hypothetical protein